MEVNKPFAGNGKCSKILNTFVILYSNKMYVFHKLLVGEANSCREDPDQNPFDLICIVCLSCVRNFRNSAIDTLIFLHNGV